MMGIGFRQGWRGPTCFPTCAVTCAGAPDALCTCPLARQECAAHLAHSCPRGAWRAWRPWHTWRTSVEH
eukprot:7391260-Pyramimonas_sp.AAC.1